MLQRKEKIDYKDYKSPKNEKNEAKENKKFIFVFIVALILIGSILAVQISQMVTITHLSYKTEELENRLNTLQNKNQDLEIEITKKISLNKIEKIAKNELGMVKAEKIKYIALNSSNKTEKNKDKINKENVSFVKSIHNLFQKLETVNASSP